MADGALEPKASFFGPLEFVQRPAVAVTEGWLQWCQGYSRSGHADGSFEVHATLYKSIATVVHHCCKGCRRHETLTVLGLGRSR